MDKFLFAAYFVISRLGDVLKFAFIAVVWGVPSFILVWLAPTPPNLMLGSAAFFVAAYFSAGFCLQSLQGWNERLRMVEALSAGDLTGAAVGRSSATGKQAILAQVGPAVEFRGLVREVNTHFTSIVTQARAGAARINAAARDIAAGNVNLSQRTEEQAATLEQTAAGMQQLAATVKANAQNCIGAQTLADHSHRSANEGDGMISQVIDTMNGIEQSAKRISGFTAVIKDIAFQTNLLALNAAVEAARAGAEGRGFAVVAIEVRSLAQRAAEAAKEIKELVDESVANAEQGGKLADETGNAINGLVMNVKEVTTRIAEIAAASAEQSAGVEEINRAVTQMESVTQQNAALVEQATAAAMTLEDEAAQLTEAVSQFRLPA